jgi:hypothetical protein
LYSTWKHGRRLYDNMCKPCLTTMTSSDRASRYAWVAETTTPAGLHAVQRRQRSAVQQCRSRYNGTTATCGLAGKVQKITSAGKITYKLPRTSLYYCRARRFCMRAYGNRVCSTRALGELSIFNNHEPLWPVTPLTLPSLSLSLCLSCIPFLHLPALLPAPPINVYIYMLTNGRMKSRKTRIYYVHVLNVFRRSKYVLQLNVCDGYEHADESKHVYVKVT